jgi:hypothetical protein
MEALPKPKLLLRVQTGVPIIQRSLDLVSNDLVKKLSEPPTSELSSIYIIETSRSAEEVPQFLHPLLRPVGLAHLFAGVVVAPAIPTLRIDGPGRD